TRAQGGRLVCRRSVLLRRVAGRGAMAMVNLPPAEAEARLGDSTTVALAVAASTGSSVVSGDVPAIEELCERWRAEGLDVRRVDTDVAFHSPQMDPLLGALAAAAADLPPCAPTIPLYSTALPDPRSAAVRDGGYWAANLRGQVRFAQAVTAAAEDGYRLFVEISAHPVVEHSLVETLDELGIEDAFVTHSLRRNRPERETLLSNLGLLYCHGATVDWAGLWPEGGLTDLPVTAWQHRPYWYDEPRSRPALTERHDPASHTLLGGRITVHGTTPVQAWVTDLDRESRPYPGSHPVREVEIIPAAVLLNSFLAAAHGYLTAAKAKVLGTWPDLTDVALRVPVSVTNPRHVQIVLQDGTLRLSSRLAGATAGPADDTGWLTHTTAALAPYAGLGEPTEVAAPEQLPAGYVVDRLATLGVAAMGFPWTVEEISRGEGTLSATIHTGQTTGWAPILDAALSAASVVFGGPPILRMPAHIHHVTLAPQAPARARVTVRTLGDDVVDVEIIGDDGVLVGKLSRLRYGVLDGTAGTVTSPRRLVHRIGWQPVPALGRETAVAKVVLVGPDTDLLATLAERFEAEGIWNRVVTTPDELRESELTSDHTVLVVPSQSPLWTLDSLDRPGEPAVRSAWLLTRAAQRIAGARLAKPARLWCVTQNVRDGEDAGSLGQGSLWGLGRIIGGEHPEFWGGIVDIGQSTEDLSALVDVLRGVRGEDVVAVREGEATVPRLHRIDGEPVRSPLTCRPDGTYLITGGLGVLGLEVAHWLADRGMRRIVLAGRQALPPRDTWDELTDPGTLARIESIRSLERLGVTVATVALDIADPDAATKLLSPAALGLPPIRGIVHAAGIVDNRTLGSLDEDALRTVLRPKVDGALVLHTLFPPGSLDFFVLFSSSGQLLNLPGQASYAAGNAFLDTLAAHRRAAGDTATTSFGWTSWRGLGMSTSSAAIDVELAARGTADISLTEAFGSWELAERYDLGYAAVLRTIPLEAGDRRPPLLSELPEDTAAGESAAEAPAEGWRELTGADLREFVIGEISAQVVTETKLAASEVDPRRALLEMGLDSVMTVRIRRALERRFGLPLPATLFWDHPTIDAVTALLAERLEEDQDRPAAA
ncbi:KR domain-containing protein, partial [Amycolatopsis sp. H20-H5]|uniref:KR domain-containing protein n=1 Tax=Amycolatopsis sp. H20-H5 TaxID=3046309 RepID=UPI002DBCDD52